MSQHYKTVECSEIVYNEAIVELHPVVLSLFRLGLSPLPHSHALVAQTTHCTQLLSETNTLLRSNYQSRHTGRQRFCARICQPYMQAPSNGGKSFECIWSNSITKLLPMHRRQRRHRQHIVMCTRRRYFSH